MVQDNRMEITEHIYEGVEFSILRYGPELEEDFVEASKTMADSFDDGFGSFERIDEGHETRLRRYGKSRVGISIFKAGLGFQEGYLVEVETETGEKAIGLIDYVKGELVPLTRISDDTEFVTRGTAEAVNGKERRCLVENGQFSAPLVNQGFLIYVGEKGDDS